jgi:dienelactone hydrolase
LRWDEIDFRRIWGSSPNAIRLAATLIFLAGMGAFVLFPQQPPASTTGPFAVGMSKLELNDPTMSPAPFVQLWYPVDLMATGSASRPPLGNWMGGWLRRRIVPIVPAAAPAGNPVRFPIILYFSGWGGTRLDNAIAVRDLASHGFVVVTVLYPARQPGASDAEYRRQIEELEEPMDFSSTAAFQRTMDLAVTRVRARARDAKIIQDELTRLDNYDPGGRFTHRLRLDRVGIFGFSFGGAVAAQAAWLDPRFRAAVNLDGWHFAEAAEQGVDRPYLLMSDDTPPPSAADLASGNPVARATASLIDQDYRRSIENLRQHGGFYVTISGTTHVNYTDAPLRSRIRRVTGAGPIAPVRAVEITDTYLREFFGKYLLDQDSDLFTTSAARFPEAHIQIWKPAE